MSVINTNMKSLITQNNLTVNNRALSSAMEKLSTGKRINTAGDDAAGLAISNKMTAQIRGLNQSVRNANDGISMIQTAEGALTEVTNMLQRMRELAVQSANDTNTSSDRFALDLEYQQLGREISRIATNTQWNAMNILNNTEVGVKGTTADVGDGVRNVKFQVGANPNQVINIGLKDFSYNLGVPAVASETKFTLGDLTGRQNFTFTMGSVSQSNDINTQDVDGTAISFSLTTAVDGAQMTEEELVDFETKLTKAITDTAGYSNVSVTRVGNDIYIKDAEGRSIDTTAFNNLSYTSASAQAADIDSVTANAQAGYQTTFTMSDMVGKKYFSLEYGDGSIANVTLANALTSNSDLSALATALDGALPATYFVTTTSNTLVIGHATEVFNDQSLSGSAYPLSSISATTVTAGSIETAAISPASSAVFSGSARLNDTQIKTQSGANQAIARLDNAMANVDHELATFGSVMNRLTFAGDNLTNVSQNTQQSRSRVLDTDYAAATTELARTQIIQQAGMAMLAQANQQPQTVLSLLQ
jgi:flagellin